MINQSNQWRFVKKASRPPLTARQADYWRRMLAKLLKVGVEVEYNLPEEQGTCDRANRLCECISVFKPETLMPDTSLCYQQCAKWDPKHPKDGNCSIAKEHGCSGVYCASFETPCPSCAKYDRGCDNCPELYDIRKDPSYVRQKIGDALLPTRFVGKHGEHGVYKVCKDGSLKGQGGVEVATVGKRVQFYSLYKMIKKILDLCIEHGAYTDQRCSIHVHLLASYLTPSFATNDKGAEYLRSEITEMEDPMPEIILANFHQLIRRYHCALIWLSAAGDHPDRLTRWEKFRKPILGFSAIRKRMRAVVTEVGQASGHKAKYAMMNYQPTTFNNKGDVSQLHVEGRYMDGMMSPAAIVAHACLLYGLMLKAVELSRHGILEAGDKAYMDLQKEILAALCNNDGGWDSTRFSDTKNLDPFIGHLEEQSKQLIRLVKNTLSEQSPADDILRALASEPIAYRRIRGDDWAKIERDIGPRIEEPSPIKDALTKIVDLAMIGECENVDEWVDAATSQISHDEGLENDLNARDRIKCEIEVALKRDVEANRLFWAPKAGGYVSG